MHEHSKVLWFGGALGAALLPFAAPLLSPVYGLIALALAVVFTGRFVWQPKMIAVFVAFIAWEIASVFWSPFPKQGWGDVVMVLPIALMGLLLGIFKVERGTSLVRDWMEIFALSTVLSWSIIFFSSIMEHGFVHYKSFELGGRLGVHFQSMYLVIAALILERRIWSGSKTQGVVRGLAVLWLLFGVVTLSARIHLIVVPVLIVLRFGELIWTLKEHRKNLTVLAVSVVVIMGVLVVALPGPRGRLVDLRNEVRSMDRKVDGKQTNHRIFIWKYGVEIGQEQPWVGSGNGATEDLLHEKLKTCTATFYRGTTPYYLHEFKYDAHNIWLQSWTEGGVIAVVLLAMLLGLGVYWSSGVLRYGWILMALSGTTESVLEKQAGVFMLAFLIALTLVAGKKKLV
jgi:O-antigen ligase